MSSHIEKYAKWIWQDYVGASWENLKLANTRSMSGDVSFCYPVGSGSKSNYRPKSVFYHYQINDIDPNKYKITSVTFKLVMGRKTSTKTNDLPSVKVFTGDNNAPYKKEPLFTTSSYKLLDNYYDFDTYTLQYTIQNVSIADLKNIIFELDWKRTKVSYTSAVSINRAEVKVNYELKKPKWGLYSSVSPSSTTTNGKVAWKLTVKNTGEVGSESVTLTLPKGVTIVSSTGNGTYNTSTKTWSFKDVGKNKSVTRTFYIKSSTVGEKKLVATNSSNYVVNKSVTDKATFTKYVPPKTADDTITYTFYETFANEERQYFDVQINGVARNHPTGTACYPIAMSSNCTLDTPLVYPNVYVLSESDDRVYGITGSYNDRICLSVEPNSDFEAHLRIFFSCDDSSDTGTVDMNANGTIFTGEFPILPPRGIIFNVDESISRDRTYVPNSINIGAEEVWTVRASMHRHNFFDEKRENMEISIEDLIAYIGVVPLSRCHKADVTADSKNSLIENRYLNRVYYGKKGDYSEDIKMTLRIPWYDVATLQGLCEMDKPIPIDTIPTRADGDPLNHRGWAEIYEITNIKKINDRLYECDVGVKYLSHDINTRFTISEAKKITEATIKYYLGLIHDFNEDLLDIFNLNYYEFFTTLEDANGDKIGSYDIDPNTSLIMNRKLNRNSTYDIVFRNQLPSLMSEDYDGNWEMALKVLNKDTTEVLFEHDYNNFKHYDFTNQYAENSADATTKYLTGNTYETLNYEKIGLGYDELSPLIEDRKIATHFNTMENIVIEDPTEQFEIFLLDADNNGIENQVVRVKIQDTANFKNSFNVQTDRYGRLLFDVDWGNGDYTIELTYDETEKYRACSYSTNVNVNFNYVEYHFEYQQDVDIIGNYYEYTCRLLDENEDGVANTTLHYSFKSFTGDYGHEETVTTDANGVAIIPIVRPSGSQILKVAFKGYSNNGTVYQPSFFESQVNIRNTGQDPVIEADNITLVQGDNEKEYHIILKTNTGVPMPSMDVKFFFYNNDENLKVVATTNEYGVASVPLYLKGGAYKVDIVFDGLSLLNPIVETRDVIVENFVQSDTIMTSDNLVLNEDKLLSGEQEYYTLTLVDDSDVPVRDEPVSILIQDSELETTYVDMILRTDVDGKIRVPFSSYDESVLVTANYYGSVHYHPVENVDWVTFENTVSKYAQTLEKGTEQVIDRTTGELADQDYFILKKNGVVQNDWVSDDCIVIFEDDNRVTSDFPRADSIIDSDFSSNNSLPRGTFKVTVLVKGDANYHSICRTLTLRKVQDNRPSFLYWCRHQNGGGYDGYFSVTHEVLTDGDNYVGDYAHIRFKFDGWIPTNTPITCYSGYVNSSTYGNVYKTIARDGYDENGKLITYFDVYGVYTSEATWRFEFADTILCKWFYYEDELPVTSSTKRAITVSQTGFAYENETYQNIEVSIADSTTPSRTIQYNQGFYIIKCYNLETNEELYYYSYITDNLQASLMQFMLTTAIAPTGNNWQIEIFVNDNDEYKCGYYTTTGRIDTQTIIDQVGLEVITQEENWIDLGYTPLSFEDGTISTDFNEYGYYEIMGMEFTNSNHYNLIFKQYMHGYNNYFIIGHNPSLETKDGLYVGFNDLTLYADGEKIDVITYNDVFIHESNNDVRVLRDGTTFKVFVNNNEIYSTELISWNTFGVYQWETQTEAIFSNFILSPYAVTDITPSTEDYDGSIFGSNIHLEIRDDKINFIDYGMLPSGAVGGGKVILNDVQLPKVNNYAIQLEMRYNNSRFERLNNLTGEIQMRVYEDISQSDTVKDYEKTLCSPMPVPNARTVFVRHSDEGTLYFVQDPLNANPNFLTNAYNQYKGGVEITTETGISLFNLDNAYSPVYVGNELVRAEFHRRSGFIRLARYDEQSGSWAIVNTLKLKNYPQLSLNEYNDDYAEISFGQTIWKFYRGRPFIVVNHEKDDLKILNLVDRVYCETAENERSMGFIEEHDANSSEFNPQLSIQQFKQDLHIGQNIKLDNFELYKVDGNGYIDDLENETDATLGITQVDNENALVIYKNVGSKVGLNFPSYSNYVKRVGDTFSLLVGYVDSTESSMTIKARGFDERGAVPCIDGIQYGIWEQSQTVSVDTQETDEIRVTFTGCPTEVKYLDFVIFFNGANNTEIVLKDLMYYDGDAIINHDVDTSRLYAEQVEVNFAETYYANIYNDKDNCGLCIIRPYQEPFSLNTIYASKETVFAPYMKKATTWDKPSQVFLEYLNAKKQIIDIDWEN